MAKISINIKSGTVEKTETKKITPSIFGIDLGTTNSLIAFINESGKSETIKTNGKQALVPSIIHLENGTWQVGQNAKPFLITDSSNTIYSVKRLIGKSFNDVKNIHKTFSYRIIDTQTDELVKIKAADKFYSPVELSALILKELKTKAENVLNTEVKKVVITVPAYFNDSQRQATRDAGKLAGLEVLRIVNEPTAASLAYGIGLNKNESKTIAVYDLGGGTFDISILKIEDGIFEVLSTNGDTYLGGDDIDLAIANYWIIENGFEPEQLYTDQKVYQQIRLAAEEAKISLSTNDFFDSSVGNLSCKLSNSKLRQLALPIIQKTIGCCTKALEDAKLTITDLDEIILAGGSTRMPLVKEIISEFFQKKVNDSMNPDEVVALGAAIQADVLAGNQQEILLIDVTPLSLGIETIGELMDVIIPRNSKIPIKASRTYTTSVDGQLNLKISVYQGERDLVKDNRKLAEFILKNIPAMPAGFPKIEISFTLNADGILMVNAKELRSNVEQTIEVKPTYGLTDSEVENMLLASISHASEDMVTRAITEAKTEATQVLRSAEKFLKQNASLLTVEELNLMKAHIHLVEQSITKNDKDQINAAMDELNLISTPFAHRAMDQAITVAMKGKQI